MFNTFLVHPLYNALVFILNTVPFADLGIAVIILTVIVRLVIFPISRNAIRSQMKMKEIQEPLKEIQEKYKNDQQKQAQEMMALYRDNNIKPFSSFLLVLIQLPIIFALYFVFSREGLPIINTDILYSFIHSPEIVNPKLLGLIDIAAKSSILAFTAAFSQFIQAQIMFKKNDLLKQHTEKNGSPKDKQKGMMDDVMRGMQIQVKYAMPIFMFFLAYSLGPVIALYFTTGNIFSIFQELYIKNKVIANKK